MSSKKDSQGRYGIGRFYDQKVFCLTIDLNSRVKEKHRFSYKDFLNRDLKRFIDQMADGENRSILKPVIELAEIVSKDDLNRIQVTWHRRNVMIALTFKDSDTFENFIMNFFLRAMSLL